MKDKYIDLIEQTFDFPQDEFTVEDNELNFHDIPLMELIKQYGTPLKITYLRRSPSRSIGQAHVQRSDGEGRLQGYIQLLLLYQSSHFSFVLKRR